MNWAEKQIVRAGWQIGGSLEGENLEAKTEQNRRKLEDGAGGECVMMNGTAEQTKQRKGQKMAKIGRGRGIKGGKRLNQISRTKRMG